MRNEVEGGELAGDGEPFAAARSASTSSGNGFSPASNGNALMAKNVDDDEDDPFDALFDALQQDPSGIRKNPFAASNTDTFPNGQKAGLSEITSPPTPPPLSQNGAAEINGNGSFAPFADPVFAEPDAFGSLASQKPIPVSAEPAFDSTEAFEELDFSLDPEDADGDMATADFDPELFVPPPPPVPPHLAPADEFLDAQADAELEAAFAEEMPDALDLDITFAPDGEADDELAAAFAEFDDVAAPSPPVSPAAAPRNVSLPPSSPVEPPAADAEAELEAAFAEFDAFEDIDFDDDFEANAQAPALSTAAQPPQASKTTDALDPEATAAIESIFTEFAPEADSEAMPNAVDDAGFADSLVSAFSDFLDDVPEEESSFGDDVESTQALPANFFGDEAEPNPAAGQGHLASASASDWEVSEPSGSAVPAENVPHVAANPGVAPPHDAPAEPNDAWEVADFADIELQTPKGASTPPPPPNPFETGIESSFYREVESEVLREPTAITSPWETASAEQELSFALANEEPEPPPSLPDEMGDPFEIEMDISADANGPAGGMDVESDAAFAEMFSPEAVAAPDVPVVDSTPETSAQAELPEAFEIDVADDFEVSFQPDEAEEAIEIDVDADAGFDVDFAPVVPPDAPLDAAAPVAELPIDIDLGSAVDVNIEPAEEDAASEMLRELMDVPEFDDAAEIPEFSFDELLQNIEEPAPDVAASDASPFAAQDTGTEQVSDSMLQSDVGHAPSELPIETPSVEPAAHAVPAQAELDPFAQVDTGVSTQVTESLQDAAASAEMPQLEDFESSLDIDEAQDPFAGNDTGVQEAPFAEPDMQAAESASAPDGFARQDTGADFAPSEAPNAVPAEIETSDFIAQDTDSHALNPSAPPDWFAGPAPAADKSDAHEAAAAVDPFAAQDTGLEEVTLAADQDAFAGIDTGIEEIPAPSSETAAEDVFASIDTGIEDNPLASSLAAGVDSLGAVDLDESIGTDPFAAKDTGLEEGLVAPVAVDEDTTPPFDVVEASPENTFGTEPAFSDPVDANMDSFAGIDTGIEDNPFASLPNETPGPQLDPSEIPIDPFAVQDTGPQSIESVAPETSDPAEPPAMAATSALAGVDIAEQFAPALDAEAPPEIPAQPDESAVFQAPVPEQVAADEVDSEQERTAVGDAEESLSESSLAVEPANDLDAAFEAEEDFDLETFDVTAEAVEAPNPEAGESVDLSAVVEIVEDVSVENDGASLPESVSAVEATADAIDLDADFDTPELSAGSDSAVEDDGESLPESASAGEAAGGAVDLDAEFDSLDLSVDVDPANDLDAAFDVDEDFELESFDVAAEAVAETNPETGESVDLSALVENVEDDAVAEDAVEDVSVEVSGESLPESASADEAADGAIDLDAEFDSLDLPVDVEPANDLDAAFDVDEDFELESFDVAAEAVEETNPEAGESVDLSAVVENVEDDAVEDVAIEMAGESLPESAPGLEATADEIDLDAEFDSSELPAAADAAYGDDAELDLPALSADADAAIDVDADFELESFDVDPEAVEEKNPEAGESADSSAVMENVEDDAVDADSVIETTGASNPESAPPVEAADGSIDLDAELDSTELSVDFASDADADADADAAIDVDDEIDSSELSVDFASDADADLVLGDDFELQSSDVVAEAVAETNPEIVDSADLSALVENVEDDAVEVEGASSPESAPEVSAEAGNSQNPDPSTSTEPEDAARALASEVDPGDAPAAGAPQDVDESIDESPADNIETSPASAASEDGPTFFEFDAEASADEAAQTEQPAPAATDLDEMLGEAAAEESAADEHDLSLDAEARPAEDLETETSAAEAADEAAPEASDGEAKPIEPEIADAGSTEEVVTEQQPDATAAAEAASATAGPSEPETDTAADEPEADGSAAPAAASAALSAEGLDEAPASAEAPVAPADPVAVDLFDDDPVDELTPLPVLEEPSVLPSEQSLDDFLEDMDVSAESSGAAAQNPSALPAELSADQPFLSTSGEFAASENPEEPGFDTALDSLDGFMAEMLGDSPPASEAQAAESLDSFFQQLSGENLAANTDPFAIAAADPSSTIAPPAVVPRENVAAQIDDLVEDAKDIEVAATDSEIEIDQESPENIWTAEQNAVSPSPAGVPNAVQGQAVDTTPTDAPVNSAPPPPLQADEEIDAVEEIEEETIEEGSNDDDSANPPSKKKRLLIAAAALLLLSLVGTGGYLAFAANQDAGDDIESLAAGERGEGEEEDEEKIADGDDEENEKKAVEKEQKKPKEEEKKEEPLNSEEAALAALEALAKGKSLNAEQVAALSDEPPEDKASDKQDAEEQNAEEAAATPESKDEKQPPEDEEEEGAEEEETLAENDADDEEGAADGEEEDEEEPAPKTSALSSTPDLSKIPKKYRKKSMPVRISKAVDASDSEVPELSLSLQEGFSYGLKSDGHARWKVSKKKQKKGHSVRLKTTDVSTKQEKQGVRVTVTCEAVTSKKTPRGAKKKSLIQAQASSSIDEIADYELTDQLTHSAAWACAHRLSKKMVAETLR